MRKVKKIIVLTVLYCLLAILSWRLGLSIGEFMINKSKIQTPTLKPYPSGEVYDLIYLGYREPKTTTL